MACTVEIFKIMGGILLSMVVLQVALTIASMAHSLPIPNGLLHDQSEWSSLQDRFRIVTTAIKGSLLLAGLLAMGGLWLSNHRCCKEERLPYPASSVLGVSFPILLFVGLLAEWWVAASQLSATSTSVTSHVTIHKRKAS